MGVPIDQAVQDHSNELWVWRRITLLYGVEDNTTKAESLANIGHQARSQL